MSRPLRFVLFANTDWYLYNFRMSLVLRLMSLGHEVLLLSPPGEYGPRMIEAGLKWRGLPMRRRSLNPFAEARLLLRIAGILRRERVDIVHGFTIKSAVYGALAARLAGVAPVASITGLGWVFISNGVAARSLRPVVVALLRLALGGPQGRVILQNSDDVALFERLRLVASDRLRLISGSGVDCERFTPPDAPLAHGAPFRVLLASRLLWDKGLQDFVDAARTLKAQGRKIEMLMAGAPDPGNPASASAAEVRSWVDEGAVRWLGHVDDMPALLRTVDVVALPSRREGLPKSLIEAAACGRPLIATDAPGCRDAVRDGVDGFLTPVGDGNALAEAIGRLQDDPGLAMRMGAAARRRAVEQFDEEIVLERTLSVYEELLGNALGFPAVGA